MSLQKVPDATADATHYHYCAGALVAPLWVLILGPCAGLLPWEVDTLRVRLTDATSDFSSR